jgi:hypothetical protein
MAEGCTWVTREGDFARFEPHGLGRQHLVLPIGAAAIFALYYNFVSALPAIAAEANLTLVDIEPSMAFNDWYLLAARWLQQQAARRH